MTSRPRPDRRAMALAAALLGACSERAPGPAVEPTPAAPATSAAASASGASSTTASPTLSAAPTTTATSATSAAGAAPERAGEPVPEAEPGDRIYVKARFAWIQSEPRPSKGWLGYLTLGGSVRLHAGSRDAAKTIGPGCDAWYRVEPRGYVCLGPETTLDPSDPVYVAVKAHAGDSSQPYPFEYGESIGAPRFDQPPPADRALAFEWDLERHRSHLAYAAAVREGKGEAATRPSGFDARYLDIDPSPANVALPELPRMTPLVREGRAFVQTGSTIAWSRVYDANGRTWLYTSDHALVPKDRVRPYPRSTFQGVRLEGDVALPIAFLRKSAKPTFRLENEQFVQAGELPRLAWARLSGERRVEGGVAYLAMRDGGTWLRASDVTVAEASATIPFAPHEPHVGRRTWLDVSVHGGTLVAYEDTRPVFATLIAPGRGGTPYPGIDPIKTASTPVGTFRVDGKFRFATMVSSTDANIVHAEVPFVQNFHGAHALHAAYWHDAWGELKSGGCVNLSPLDSKWMFEFTEPTLPKDWHGLRSVPEFGAVTRVVVRP